MLAWKMENTYLLEAGLQTLAGQIFDSNKTRVQGMHSRQVCRAPLCAPTYGMYAWCVLGHCNCVQCNATPWNRGWVVKVNDQIRDKPFRQILGNLTFQG